MDPYGAGLATENIDFSIRSLRFITNIIGSLANCFCSSFVSSFG